MYDDDKSPFGLNALKIVIRSLVNHSLSKLIQAHRYKHTVKLIYFVPP